jgi:hypothetical protein
LKALPHWREISRSEATRHKCPFLLMGRRCMTMSSIGVMAMPANFRYREVFLKGRPRHDRYDPFRIRHPSMDRGHRAKIFAPFDALKGFNEAVSAKDVLYEDRIELLKEDTEELSRRLNILHNLTFNGRMARANRVQVTVTYYEPCSDENHEAFGLRGQYKTITGICWNVDAEVGQTILIDKARISLGNVLKIDASGDLFKKDWDDPWTN